MSARDRGKQIEQAACRFLQRQGLALVTQNYLCRGGEIDLIMRDDQTLVFVEVRFRKHRRYGGALESIDLRKQSRIIHTAGHYLQHHPGAYSACRFDVLAASPLRDDYAFNWIKDAFRVE